jgi:hypothetical protein
LGASAVPATRLSSRQTVEWWLVQIASWLGDDGKCHLKLSAWNDPKSLRRGVLRIIDNWKNHFLNGMMI